MQVAAAASPRLVSTEYPRRGRGVAAIHQRNIRAARDPALEAELAAELARVGEAVDAPDLEVDERAIDLRASTWLGDAKDRVR